MKKALILGASSGIGREIAMLLAKKEYELGLMARRLELLKDLQKKISTPTHIGHLDLSHTGDAIEKVQEMIQEMRGVDLIIINAGIGFLNPQLDWHQEKQTLDVNVYGFCAMANVAYHYFAKQGYGHLVGISSIAALRGNAMTPAYNASKAFMSNYLEGLRKKAFNEKLSLIITDIKPGFVDTDMAKGEGKFWMASPQEAAQEIISAVAAEKKHAYITKRWRLIAWILKLSPDWLYRRMP